MKQVPVLIFTDSPELQTGLARIGRDLGNYLRKDGRFKVGHVGFFGTGSDEYENLYPAGDINDGISQLPWICHDFSPNENPILLTITPPSWIFPLACPQYAIREDPKLRWLHNRPFKLFSYLALEGVGPNGMTRQQRDVVLGCDSMLMYSQFGVKKAYLAGLGHYNYAYHGIDLDVFKPDKSNLLREEYGIEKDDVVVGCCMTNSARKDMGQLFQIMRELKIKRKMKLWLHTNAMIKDWNIPELAYENNMTDHTLVTINDKYKTDRWLSMFYNSCDITILPTKGEGFGYPIVESQCCGTPCVVTGGGAQEELTPWSVEPITWVTEGINSLSRPITLVSDWVDMILYAMKERDCINTDNFSWSIQGKLFSNWLLKGIDTK